MKRTSLYETHKKLKAKFMEFGGYDMPLQYTGIIEEHLAVRSAAGIFDVSHMGEIFISGRDACAFCEHLTPNHVARLSPGQAQYSFLLNERGGVVDDLIVYRLGDDRFMLCVNASNTDKDYQWILSHKEGDVVIDDRSEQFGLISVQGPSSPDIMAPIFSSAPGIRRFTFGTVDFNGREVYLSRTGYTGEDGYECFVGSRDTVDLWNAIMEQGARYGLRPVGLGARDTLRTEMGYPLYGMELDDATSPLAANLGWVIKVDKGDFIGRDALIAAAGKGLDKKLTGIVMQGRSIPRHKNPVVWKDRVVGEVTTGTYSPSLSRGIAIAYLDSDVEAKEVGVDIRSILHTGTVLQLPFIKK